MKTSIALVLLVAAVCLTGIASTQESPSVRLALVELEHASGIASGMTADHPKMKGIKAELDVLSQQPNIRNEEYIKTLEEQKIHVQADLAKLHAEGYMDSHPKMQVIKAKADVIENLLKLKG